MSECKCDRCGACCRQRMCPHLTKDNLCAIYETRPDICKVDEVYKTLGADKIMTIEEYYKITEIGCELLRSKEKVDRLSIIINGFLDKVRGGILKV